MKRILKSVVVAILEWESRLILKKYKPKIVAVTGSVGKTSAKDSIYTVLEHFFYVRKSRKSYNSEIGVPLTILGVPNAWNNPFKWFINFIEGLFLIIFKFDYPDWLVLEVGADRPGDIKRITEIIKPDIAVVTRLAKIPVHVEYFGSPENLYKEKGNLVSALKADGVLVLNSDDEDVLLFEKEFVGKKIKYGFNESANLKVSDIEICYGENGTSEGGFAEKPSGISFLISKDDKKEKVVLKGLLGRQHAYAVLAGFAVGDALGLDLKGMANAFDRFELTKGRMRIISGIKNTTIIDDSYNSSPVALAEALNTLNDIKTTGRKIAVLGDMLELGVYTLEEHKKAGARSAEICDLLFTVGVRARAIAEGALNAEMSEKNIFQYEDSISAGKDLDSEILPDDVILIKGSQGIRMERTVIEIMQEPEKKRSLLVRQDEGWGNR